MTLGGDAVAGADLRGNDTSAPVSDSAHTVTITTADRLSGPVPTKRGRMGESLSVAPRRVGASVDGHAGHGADLGVERWGRGRRSLR